jgi:hypothetical protein
MGLGSVVVVTLCALAAVARPASEKRAFMAPLLSNLQVLLPLSTPAQALADPDHRTTVEHALVNLSRGADALATHVRNEEPGVRSLGEAVAGEARLLVHLWRRGDVDATAYGLQKLTRLCIGCHSTLPAANSALSRGFVDDTHLARRPAHERAELLLATRRFDEALTTWEVFFRDPSVRPAQMMGPLVDYLVTAVRVQQDPARASAALAHLAARTDSWGNLREQLSLWRRDLAALAAKPPVVSLAAARALVDEADARAAYPADRGPLVRWIAASSVLHQLLDARSLPPHEAAEAYYLLTLAEARIEQDFRLTEAEAYLSACIELAPHSDVALGCYHLLEEQLVLGLEGTGGGPLPQELEQRLRALEAQAAPPGRR